MITSQQVSTVKSFFLFISLLLAGAVYSQDEYYIPKALIIPVHKNSQELHVSLGKGGGTDLNISYALTKHLALFTTANVNKGVSLRRSFFGGWHRIRKNDYAFKGGIGYFASVDGKLIHQIESYAGYGKHKVHNNRFFKDEPEVYGFETNAAFYNIFWQIQATHKTGRCELTAALRLAYSKYSYLEYLNKHPNDMTGTVSIEEMWGRTIDPAIGFSYIMNNWRCNLQLGVSGFSNTITIHQGAGTAEYGLDAPLGRISIQKNFQLRKKNQ
jgi:hypothetical protein